MLCNIDINNPIFDVQLVSRGKVDMFIFVGIVNNIYKKIFKKIEENEKINKEEQQLLENEYKPYFKKWIENPNNVKIKFIYDKIQTEDSIRIIKNKIFVYLSNPKKNYYILPINQQLWVKLNSGKYKVLGYVFNEGDIQPETYQKKISIDKTFVDEAGQKIFRNDLINKNNVLIGDIIDQFNLNSYTIYISDAVEAYRYLTKKKIKIGKKLLYGYFYKYWPLFSFQFNNASISKEYKLMNSNFQKEKYIYNIIRTTKIDPAQFSSCNIAHVTIQINNNKTDDIEKDTIDMYKIFDYLKRKIGPETPFIKYRDPEFKVPISVAYDGLITNKNVTEKMFKSWIGLKKEKTETGDEWSLTSVARSLQFKRLIGDFGDRLIYSTIEIASKNTYKNTRVTVRCGFKEKDHATMKNVSDIVSNCSKILEEINQLGFSSVGKKFSINLPDIEVQGPNIKFKENTKIAFINVITKFDIGEELDMKILYNLAKSFKNFIDIVGSYDDTKSTLQVKYKKVSNYTNMRALYAYITEVKKDGMSDNATIDIIEKKFDKTYVEASDALKNWKKTDGIVDENDKSGINVSITKESIRMDGLLNVRLIVSVYRFFVIFIHIYANLSEYKKNNMFKKIVLDDKLYLPDSDMYAFTPLIERNEWGNYDNDDEVDEENNSLNSYEYDHNSLYGLSVNHHLNNADGLAETNDLVTSNGRRLASDKEIGSDVRLSCGNSETIVNIDTCGDLCQDKKYFLRRLQRHDLRLFKFTLDSKKKKITQYSRQCQTTQGKLPSVLPYDPATNPKIDRSSYTFAVPYSSNLSYTNWYMCPQAWCPYCQIPVPIAQVTDIRRKMTDLGEHCNIGKCPHGDHDVILRDSGNIYPGFLGPGKHPDGLCLPCCYAAPHNNPKSSYYKKFMKCMGEEVNTIEKNKDEIYVLSKGAPLENNRYGMVPVDVAKILGTKCASGYLEDTGCYLRRGIEQSETQSFLYCMANICAVNKKEQCPGNVKQLKTYLTGKLTQTLFKSLIDSLLEYKFFNPNSKLSALDNFKKYILSDEKISYEFLWDFLQRKGILFRDGVNIIIFQDNSIICPFRTFVKEFYDPIKPTVLIIKSRQYFEPIYYVEESKGRYDFRWVFDSSSPEIKNIFKLVKEQCEQRHNIDWQSVLKDSEKKYEFKYDINITPQITLKSVINKLEKIQKREYQPKVQIADSIGRIFILQLGNGLLLPCDPSGLIIELPFSNLESIRLLDYSTTIKHYNYIGKHTSIKIKPIYSILNQQKNKIIAIMVETGRMVPIKSSNIPKDHLPIKDLNYFLDADYMIQHDISLPDKRVEEVAKLEFENESYQRLRFEISRYFADHSGTLDQIKDIIKNDDIPIDKKRSNIMKVISSLTKILVTFKNQNLDLTKYAPPNVRIPCFKQKGKNCGNDPHCSLVNGSCKLYIGKKNLINNKNNLSMYSSMLVEEILRNKMKRSEIFNNKIPDVLDKTLITYDKNTMVFNEVDPERLNRKINKLFAEKSMIFINETPMYNEVTSEHYSFDSDKYRLHDRKLEHDLLQLEFLSIYWEKILGSSYKVFNTGDESIFVCMHKVLNYLIAQGINSNSEVWYDTSTTKKLLINFFDNITQDEIKGLSTLLNNSAASDQMPRDIVDIYKFNCPRTFKEVTDLALLKTLISMQDYKGCDVDVILFSLITKMNIIVLDKRIKQGAKGYNCFGPQFFNSDNFILIYGSYRKEDRGYGVIQSKGKYVFTENDFPKSFITHVVSNCFKNMDITCHKCIGQDDTNTSNKKKKSVKNKSVKKKSMKKISMKKISVKNKNTKKDIEKKNIIKKPISIKIKKKK